MVVAIKMVALCFFQVFVSWKQFLMLFPFMFRTQPTEKVITILQGIFPIFEKENLIQISRENPKQLIYAHSNHVL